MSAMNNFHLQTMQNAALSLDAKLRSVRAELAKIKSLCDCEAPIYYAERKAIEAACSRALRALEEP